MGKKDKEEKKKGRAGAFFGGTFVGFIFCIALLAGLVCFVYFKVSPNWINKTFKTDIDLGSEEINQKTVSDIVKIVSGISENRETYTLNNFSEDFGIEIKDELFGVKIDDLKGVGLSKLSKAVEDKFGAISADELRNVAGMNLEASMGKILDMDVTYYFNPANQKLYKTFDGSQYLNLVDFDYSLSGGKIITKGHETNIQANNEVKIQLWYLPLTAGLGDFTSNLGDNITLAELETKFGVTLPSFLNNERINKSNTTINELEGAINSLYVADFLGFTVDATDPNNIIIKDGGTTVTGVMATLAKFTVEGLEDGIDGLTLSQIFTEEQMNSGIFSLLTTDPTLAEIPTAVENAVKEATIQELYDEGIITLDTNDANKLTVKIDHDNNTGTATVAVGSLTIDQLMDYCFDLLPNA